MIARALSLFAIFAVCAAAQTAAPNAGARANAKSAPPQAAPATTADDVDAVVQLIKGGMPESLVVKTIQKSGKKYTLAPTDVLRLRKAGVGDTVIEAMMDASPMPAVSPPTPRNPAPTAGNAAGSPGDREPTEAELLTVFQEQFASTNAALKDKEGQCKSGAYKNDPMLAMECLGTGIATGGRGGLGKKITGFRKIACSGARGEAGWNCDYVLQMDVSGFTGVSPSMRELMTTPTIQHGRFVHTGGRWIQVS
jgi:hypothetical protein